MLVDKCQKALLYVIKTSIQLNEQICEDEILVYKGKDNMKQNTRNSVSGHECNA